nr:hypothetical protein [Streptomyces sp. WAC 00631]
MPAETEPATVRDTAAGGTATGGGPSGSPAASNPAGTGSLDGAGPEAAAGDGAPRYAPEWLALREGADAAARAPRLLGPLVRHWAGGQDGEEGQPQRPGRPGRRARW